MMPPDSRNLISALIRPETVRLALTGHGRDEVLAELVALVPEIAGRPADRDRLLAALREREDLHSTGVGDGVALPHARNALVGLVSNPLIVFGRHPKGVAFGAVDGKPVHLFFLLVTTSVTQHLQVLARISRLLRDTRLRETLMTAGDSATVLATLRQAEN